MKTYNQFNESISNKIRSDKTLMKLPPDQKLKYGCIYGHLLLVKLAVEQGVDIHQNDEEPILMTCNYGYVDITKYLLDNGVNVHLKDDYLLRFACNNGELEIVKLLIEYGANIHVQNDKPLRWACEKGHYDVVKYLIEKGANIHVKNDMPLKLALDNNHKDIVKLLKNYTKINESVRDLMTPKSKEEILKSLNANPDREFKRSEKDDSGWLIGKVFATYDILVKLFGKPIELDDSYLEEEAEQLFAWNIISNDGHILEIFDRHTRLTKNELMNIEHDWYIRGQIEQDAKDLAYFIYKNTI